MNAVKINPFLRQRADALSAGIAIVRKILNTHSFPEGFTTKQIYELAQDYPAPPKFEPFVPSMRYHGMVPVPRPDHPVRSIRLVLHLYRNLSIRGRNLYSFLKNMILPSLEGCQEIVTVRQSRSGAHPDPDLSNLRPIKRTQRFASGQEFVWKVVPPEERRHSERPKEKKTEVGPSTDISHLNKRRQRARVGKVAKAVLQLKGQMPFSEDLEAVSNIGIKPR